jgi:hypothetical protein
MSDMLIPGETSKRFKVYRSNKSRHDVFGEALGEYDTEIQVLAHLRRRDWHYVVYERRKPVSEPELAERIWTCEFCEQKVIMRPGSALPILPPGHFDNCKLRDHMVGNECIARRDPETATRLLGGK